MLRRQNYFVGIYLIFCAFIQIELTNGQLRPISLPGIFSVMRYQNSACDGENEETGVCLYEVNDEFFATE